LRKRTSWILAIKRSFGSRLNDGLTTCGHATRTGTWDKAARDEQRLKEVEKDEWEAREG